MEPLQHENKVVAHPFVKWAGGKRQLLEKLQTYFPKNFGTYFEPFLGGGAVFFHVASNKNNTPFKAVLSDVNDELMITYSVIEKKVEELIPILKGHEKNYFSSPKDYFYKIRDPEPNESKLNCDIERAARFIFLNRTCFNGLYRVNSKNKFNVPWGKYEKPIICNEMNLRAVSRALNLTDAEILIGDYKQISEKAKSGDVIYFDPPYHPVSQTANFTSYTKDGFSKKDQEDLANLCRTLYERGCKVIVSNSDTKEIQALYSDKKIFEAKKVTALRAINCKGTLRTGHSELIIKTKNKRVSS